MIYLAALVFCGVFYIAYGQWLSFLVLAAVLGLPWLSLLLSLPAICTFRIRPTGPDAVEMGQIPELWLAGSCPLPMPPFYGKLKLTHTPSGRTAWYSREEEALTEHCGSLTVTPAKLRVCDYLGLFAFPLRAKTEKTILIRPRPLPVAPPPALDRQLAQSWVPKNGGFSENHELRPYRPGDSLNRIHWKLSAKTGSLVLRQPMAPRRGLVLLTMHLRGTPEETDRKFGRLLDLGRQLLDRQVPFSLQVLTKQGLLSFSVSTREDLEQALSSLLPEKPMTEGTLPPPAAGILWQYHLGGEPDAP